MAGSCSHEPTHAVPGLDQGADRPAFDRPDVAPATDVVAEPVDPVDQIFDLIRARQGATETVRRAQAHAGEHVTHAFTDRAGDTAGVGGCRRRW